jgi:hypothetical protein
MREGLQKFAQRDGVNRVSYGGIALEALDRVLLPQYLLSALKDPPRELHIYTQLPGIQYLQSSGIRPEVVVSDGRVSDHNGGFFATGASYVAFEGQIRIGYRGTLIDRISVYQIQTGLSVEEMEDVLKQTKLMPDIEEGLIISSSTKADRWKLVWNGKSWIINHNPKHIC